MPNALQVWSRTEKEEDSTEKFPGGVAAFHGLDVHPIASPLTQTWRPSNGRGDGRRGVGRVAGPQKPVLTDAVDEVGRAAVVPEGAGLRGNLSRAAGDRRDSNRRKQHPILYITYHIECIT